jgi:oxygen-independent coproporphyrinogen III oxidase
MAGIYIHIPFCRKICYYCDFYRTASVVDTDRYVTALEKEIEMRADYLKGERIETLYFGGGTPSVLNAVQIQRLLQKIMRVHSFGPDCEITLEANPDDLTDSYCRSLKGDTPVNRMSIGIQSFIDRDLTLMNRRHTAEEGYRSLERVLKAGFSNISADIIYGIPGSSAEDLGYNLDRLFELDIPHLSAYHLTIEPGTVFYKKAEKGLLKPAGEEESISQFRYLIGRAGQHRMIHYEISNWAREGCFSRHNTGYWKRKPYLGLGPSAHSYDVVSRQWNPAHLIQYMQAMEEGKSVAEKEVLSAAMRYNEYLLTSLRTMWGIDLEEIKSCFGKTTAEKLVKDSSRYLLSGHMKQNDNILTLTVEGLFISDAIVSDLMTE